MADRIIASDETFDVDLKRPIYEGKVLTYDPHNQVLWMERFIALERQVAELTARLNVMEAGK